MHNFQINLTIPASSNFGFITLDGQKIFHIDDVDGFYNALGFTDEHSRRGVTPEEFLWQEYRKQHCNKTYACMQHKIIDYISHYLPKFKEDYADQYTYWIYRCSEIGLKVLPMCAECKLRLSAIAAGSL